MLSEWCGEAGASGASTRRSTACGALRCQVGKEYVCARRIGREGVAVAVAEDVDVAVAVAVDVAVEGERDLRFRACLET